MKVDTTAIDQEIANYEKQLRQDYSIKAKLMEEIDNLNPDDRHYIRRKVDLDDRLYRMYDKIEELEEQLIAEIQIYEERKPNGQWLKSIRFKLPIIENDLSIGLDNGNQVDCRFLLRSYVHAG